MPGSTKVNFVSLFKYSESWLISVKSLWYLMNYLLEVRRNFKFMASSLISCVTLDWQIINLSAYLFLYQESEDCISICLIQWLCVFRQWIFIKCPEEYLALNKCYLPPPPPSAAVFGVRWIFFPDVRWLTFRKTNPSSNIETQYFDWWNLSLSLSTAKV